MFNCVQLSDPMDCSLPGSSLISQARILEWVVIPFSRGSSQPRNWTQVSCVSCIGRQIFYHCPTWEASMAYLWLKKTSWIISTSTSWYPIENGGIGQPNKKSRSDRENWETCQNPWSRAVTGFYWANTVSFPCHGSEETSVISPYFCFLGGIPSFCYSQWPLVIHTFCSVLYCSFFFIATSEVSEKEMNSPDSWQLVAGLVTKFRPWCLLLNS